MRGESAPPDDALSIDGERTGRLPARSVRVPVPDPPTGEAHHGNQRSAPEEMREACATKSPRGVGTARGIARNLHKVCATDRAAPALGRLLRRMTDREPLHPARASRRITKDPQGLLRERAAGVAQERDNRRAAGLNRYRKTACRIARLRCGDQRQRAWREERPRIHERTVTSCAAPVLSA